jgi:hypothetical protein
MVHIEPDEELGTSAQEIADSLYDQVPIVDGSKITVFPVHIGGEVLSDQLAVAPKTQASAPVGT